MRTDHIFRRPEPTHEESQAIAEWRPSGFGITDVLETGDAPDLVLRFAQRHADAHAEWIAGAKDRPMTIDDLRGPARHVRLFAGDWFDMRSVPAVIEATFRIGPAPATVPIVPGDPEGIYERRCATVWRTYEGLVAAGDEEGCRELAAAIYEYIGVNGRGGRLLCDVANKLEGRVTQDSV